MVVVCQRRLACLGLLHDGLPRCSAQTLLTWSCLPLYCTNGRFNNMGRFLATAVHSFIPSAACLHWLWEANGLVPQKRIAVHRPPILCAAHVVGAKRNVEGHSEWWVAQSHQPECHAKRPRQTDDKESIHTYVWWRAGAWRWLLSLFSLT